MKILTKLEELILLSVWRLRENSYGITIYRHIQQVTGKKISLGGVYFPLDRLTKNGFLKSYTGEASGERRGLSKRYYEITDKGRAVLNEMKRVNEIMWDGLTDLTFSSSQEK